MLGLVLEPKSFYLYRNSNYLNMFVPSLALVVVKWKIVV